MNVELWLVDTRLVQPAGELTAAERQRAARFIRDTDRDAWAGAHTALRRIIGERIGVAPARVPLGAETSGRPVVAWPQLEVSLSHSGPMAAVALGSDRLGVDVEQLRCDANLAAAADWALGAAVATLPAQQPTASHEFLRHWVVQEAYSKFEGTGLNLDFRAIRVHLTDNTVTTPSQWRRAGRCWRFEIAGLLVGAVVTADPDAELQVRHLTPAHAFTPHITACQVLTEGTQQ